MKKNALYYIAAVLWGIPGVIISVKGVRAYLTMPAEKLFLIIFMLGLGMALKFIPGIPDEFIASFYSGLGPMLMFAAGRFVYNRWKNN